MFNIFFRLDKYRIILRFRLFPNIISYKSSSGFRQNANDHKRESRHSAIRVRELGSNNGEDLSSFASSGFFLW